MIAHRRQFNRMSMSKIILSVFIQALIGCFCILIVSSTLSPCAKWNTSGRTVAGTGESGNSSSQINSAKGLFIHKKRNELYVADFYNNRVQRFSLSESSKIGVTVASGIENPMKVFVDDDSNGPTVYVSLRLCQSG